MATETLETRMTAVERELAEIKRQLATDRASSSLPWREQIFGTFAGNEPHKEATSLGQVYRSRYTRKMMRMQTDVSA